MFITGSNDPNFIDVIYGDRNGHAEDDEIHGLRGNDLLFGLGGDDSLYGGEGADTLRGGDDNDILRGGAGADYLSGGKDVDFVYYDDSSEGVVAFIGGYCAGGTAEGDFIENDVEGLAGSRYTDFLFGNDSSNALFGGDAADYLFGNGGADKIFGDSGNDILRGGLGSDGLFGGSGYDTADYSDSYERVVVFIGGGGTYGTAQGDTVSSTVENLSGSAYGDALVGDAGSNTLDGWTGDDYLSGHEGSDRLIGGKGADTMTGGDGEDTVSYLGSSAGVWVDLRGGYASGGDAQGDYLYKDIEDFQGSHYDDVVIGSSVSNYITGNDGHDRVYADGGNDYVFGGNGHDGMSGELGDDQLYGDAGNDTMFGGAGRDYLNGGDGHDVMTGGTGSDFFRFDATALGDADTIKDFHRSEGDKINLTSIDANANLAGNQAFIFIGTAAFSGVAGQLHYLNTGFNTFVTGDINGDKISDFEIILSDAPGLIASDFNL